MEATIINTIVKDTKIEIGLPNSYNNHEVEVIVVMKEDNKNTHLKNYTDLINGNNTFDFLNDDDEDIYDINEYKK